MEGGGNVSEECCVCGRQLGVSRWVRGGSQLRHSGRAVAEAVTELLGCEARLSRLCFRCYRLVLGLDYHTHQMHKQKTALLRLYREREKTQKQCGVTTSEDTAAGIDGDGACVGPCGTPQEGAMDVLCNLPQKEVLDADSASKEVYEGNTNVDKSEKIDIASVSGSVCLYDTPQTGGLDAVTIGEEALETHTGADRADEQKSDASGADYSKHSYDHEYHKNSTVDIETHIPVAPLETSDLPRITAGGHQDPLINKRLSVGAKRRKTAKKWDDFEYYEDESRTSEMECDGMEHFPSTHQFQLPLRTGRRKCPKCKEEFSTKKAVLNHQCHKTKKKEREKVTYTCKGCLHMFLLRREYIKHADACYKNTPVTCKLCLVKLPSAAYLPRHLAALHQVKPPLSKGSILCEACGRGFSRKEALERHEARVHGKAHGSHQCPLCGRTFPHTSLLAEHLRAHQGYTCPECSKVFSCRSNLTLHRRAHHMRKAAYHCTACNKHWKFHASYTYHMKKFHGNTEQRCVRCRLVVYSEEALRQHSLTCCVEDSESTGQDAAFVDRQGSGREVIKPVPNSSSDCGPLLTHAQLSKKGPDSLVLLSEVRKMQVYQPQSTSHQASPAGEIIVEVLEDSDTDYQYIILVEDAAVAHFTMAETAMWNPSGRQ